MARVSMPLFA
jgi:hypothetical protein